MMKHGSQCRQDQMKHVPWKLGSTWTAFTLPDEENGNIRFDIP